ncbi:MAG: hypothetical protein M0Z98_05255, partial [Actinomycetales bacterium]|nr:hypothetical protein [Actinomycetales bacterium]
MDGTVTPGGAEGPEGSPAHDGVHPDDVTAPQPVVAGPQQHEGSPGATLHGSAPGHAADPACTAPGPA